MNTIIHKTLKALVDDRNAKVKEIRDYADKIGVDARHLGGFKISDDLDHAVQRMRDRWSHRVCFTQKDRDFTSILKLCTTVVDNCNHTVTRKGDMIKFDRYRLFFHLANTLLSDLEADILSGGIHGMHDSPLSLDTVISTAKDNVMFAMSQMGFNNKHIWLASLLFNLYREDLCIKEDSSFDIDDLLNIDDKVCVDNYTLDFVLR